MMDCQTLAEAFEKVGFKIDDHVSRRDLVQIYQAIEQDTKAEVKRLTDQRQYDEAKVLNERCKFMRKEFEQHLVCPHSLVAAGRRPRSEPLYPPHPPHPLRQRFR